MREQRISAPLAGPTREAVVRHFQNVCEILDTAVSLSCFLLAENGEWDQLVSKTVSSDDYLFAESFRNDYLAVSILSKADFLPTSFNRREAAKKKFWEAEKVCGETNVRLGQFMDGICLPLSRSVLVTLNRAQQWIARVLGKVPSMDFPGGRFGPGSTSVVKGRYTLTDKYDRLVEMTPRLYPYWRDVCGPEWASCVTDVRLRASNRVTFVSKNAKTDRVIAIEPHLNVYAQLGVSEIIRSRLRRVGIDLSSLADVNRMLVANAFDWRLATIDLSSASDTVARKLVELLLPEDWYDLLDRIRSPYGELDGLEFRYEKFSSMGNGTTFELETLIFTALALATGSDPAMTSVFGDDIIVEACRADSLLEVLSFCGFEVNTKKTFLAGSFYESCGQDYFVHTNVRPFFWKTLDVSLHFKVINDISRYAHRSAYRDHYRDARFLPAWLRAFKSLPPRLRDCRVPVSVGDSGVISDASESDLRPAKNGWFGYTVRCLKISPSMRLVDSCLGSYLASLDGYHTQGDDGRETGYHPIRGSEGARVATQFAFGRWVGLGAWM